MTIDELLAEVVALLQREGRVSYRMLKRRFGVDDEYLEDLKAELIDAKRLAIDEDGKVLVWAGGQTVAGSWLAVASPQSPTPNSQPPISYTPPHLAQRIRAEQAAMETRGASDGERKTITALFADLKGSTALIEVLDPEEARAIIDPALHLMMDAVHRYEGYVAQALGDGVFALFGAPIAHEDRPRRALYAALRMQEDMRHYSDQVRLKGGPPLQMRVGVNTGEVVVRSIRKDDLHTDYVPVGHSINLAARMEQMATPGSILITEYTRKLVEGYFELKALGAAHIKGVEQPLHVYEVLSAEPLRTRLQVAVRRGLTRFVGRHSEMEQLRRALEQAEAGRGQIVGVMGEPGVGKSRLFYEFKLTSQSGCLVLEAYSVSHGKASAYLPVMELLKHYFQIQPQDDERSRRQKVIGRVLELDHSLKYTLPYLFTLLGIDDQKTSNLQQMDAQLRRRRTFDALKRLFLRESLNQPLMLIFEDLHWIDSETQDFLDMLSDSVAGARILLLVNYRPEYQQVWGQKTYYTQLRLAPLGKAEAEELLTFLSGNDASLTALKQLILEKTEGTPFFMEEVVQTLVEEGVLIGERGNFRVAKTPTTLCISPTVQGVLAARVDRLTPEEKALLQQLAVMGREFPLSLVKRVVSYGEDELYRLLTALQRKEFLYERPAFPEVEYIFKHVLTQEVVYGSVLVDRRKTLHEHTAQAIESLYSPTLEDHYSELAHHYSRSGNTPKAVEYLQRAGQQAVQRSANAEAIGHFTTALALLKTLPNTQERVQQELALQIVLGVSLMVTKGTTAPEVGEVYSRTRELCQQIGEPRQLFQALWGLRLFHTNRGELHTARELGEQLLLLAQSLQDPVLLPQAHRALGGALFYLGEFTAAQEHMGQGMALYARQYHHSHALLYGQDPGVTCLSGAALVLWYLGYPDQALRKSTEALTLARELLHPYSLAFALIYDGQLHQLRREERLAQERAEALMTLASEQGFAEVLAMGISLRGWALVEQGRREEGIAEIRRSLEAYRAIEVQLWRSCAVVLLAEAYGRAGQAEEGLSVLAEVLAVMNKNGSRWYEAEVYRLKGELLLKHSEVRSQNAESSPQHLAPKRRLKPKPAFGRPLRLPVNSKQNPWNSVQLLALLACGSSRARRTKPGRCWPKPTAGLPRGSTRLT